MSRAYDHSQPLLLSDLLDPGVNTDSNSSEHDSALTTLLARYNDLLIRHQLLQAEKAASDQAAHRVTQENASLWRSLKGGSGGGGVVSGVNSRTNATFGRRGSATTTTDRSSASSSSGSEVMGLGLGTTGGLGASPLRRDASGDDSEPTPSTTTTTNGTNVTPGHYAYMTTSPRPLPPPHSTSRDEPYEPVPSPLHSTSSLASTLRAKAGSPPPTSLSRNSSSNTSASGGGGTSSSMRETSSSDLRRDPSPGGASQRRGGSSDVTDSESEVDRVSQGMMATRSNEGRQYSTFPPKTPPQPSLATMSNRSHLLGDSRTGLSSSTSVPINLSAAASGAATNRTPDNRRGLLPQIAPVSPLYSPGPVSGGSDESHMDPSLRPSYPTSTYLGNGNRNELLPPAHMDSRRSNRDRPISEASTMTSSSASNERPYSPRHPPSIRSASSSQVTSQMQSHATQSDPFISPTGPHSRQTSHQSDREGERERGREREYSGPPQQLQQHQQQPSRQMHEYQDSDASTLASLPLPLARWSNSDASTTSSSLPLPRSSGNSVSGGHRSSSPSASSSAPPSPHSIPLLPAHLPHTRVRINHSSLRTSEKGKEVVVFAIDVHVLRPPPDSNDLPLPLPSTPQWRIEKSFADVITLDSALRNKASKSEVRAFAPLPDKALFKDHAPLKSDQRKLLVERYLQTLLQVPFKDKNVVCSFLTSNVELDSNGVSGSSASINGSILSASTASAPGSAGGAGGEGAMEGWLTKRGRHLGGWQTRYYVLNPGVALMYHETKDGLKIGEIPLANVAIGRQSSRGTDIGDDAYLHAFLIRATYEKEGEQDHILCAESDEVRDLWVQALTRLPSNRMPTPANNTTPANATPAKNDTSSSNDHAHPIVTIDEGSAYPPSPTYPASLPPSTPASSRHAPSQNQSSLSPFDAPGRQDYGGASANNGDLAPSASMPANLDAVARGGGGFGGLSFDPERRSTSAQGHRSVVEKPGPAVLRRPHVSAQTMERGHSPAEDARKHDSIASSASGNVAGKFSASDVSSPMNAVPLPSGVNFKSPNANKDGTKADRRKTKSFWGGFGRADKSSTTNSMLDGGVPAMPEIPLRPVFGVPLTEAVAISRIRPGLELPSVVYRCVEYLEAKNAESEEGIFRLSGSANVIRVLRERFSTEGDVNLLAINEYVDPHAVAGLLKSFLRELPGHILTRELHSEFLQVIDMRNRKDRVNTLGSLVARLPIEEYTLFRFLFAHLCVIAQNAEVNKMNLRNLGIVFSPTLAIPAPLFSMLLSEFDLVFAIEAETGMADPVTLKDEPSEEVQAERRRQNRNSELYSASGAPMLMEQDAIRLPLRDLDFGGTLSSPTASEWFEDVHSLDSNHHTAAARFVHGGRLNQVAARDASFLAFPMPSQHSALPNESSSSSNNHNSNGGFGAGRHRSRSPAGLPASPRPGQNF